MSRAMDQRRLRHLAFTGAAALILLTAGGIASWRDAQMGARPSASGPVLPEWEDSVPQIAGIDILTAGQSFTIARSEAGWVLPERGDHPASPARLAELDQFLGALRYAAPATRDYDKHERIGLGAPSAGGNGLRITARDAQGQVLADLILGEERGGRVYLRLPGAAQSWAAETPRILPGRPDVDEISDWMDLDFLAMGQIARTVITPETGPSYVLERGSPSLRNFSLRDPAGWTPITAGAGNGPGAGLSRLRLRDVRRASDLPGPAIARHQAENFEGLRVRLEVRARGEERWAVIRAEALTDDAAQQAEALNARTEGWAYLLSDVSAERLLRPLDGIADPSARAQAETADGPGDEGPP